MLNKEDKIVIVGAGCFGLSTAYHLLQDGFLNVIILDRSAELPAPDAASNDLNRVVRTSYSDNFYASFALEAIYAWRDQTQWPDCYHESGVLVVGDKGYNYTDEAYRNDLNLGSHVESFDKGNIQKFFPHAVHLGTFDGSGYFNPVGGWVNAGKGTSVLLDKVVALGGHVLKSKNVNSLIKDHARTQGVRCVDGSVYQASLVILATGSWTPSAFPDLDFGKTLLATGQCIAMIQLSLEEGHTYRKCPVYLDFNPDSGYYCFPPNEDNLVKMAIHGAGFTSTSAGTSTPRTVVSDPDRGLLIPKVMVNSLREQFRRIYPSLASKPFVKTRMCWYSDTPDENWMIGFYPGDEGLILATGDSGHAFKFLPVIGSLAAKLVQGTLDADLVKRFAINRKMSPRTHARPGTVQELVLDELCSPDDLM